MLGTQEIRTLNVRVSISNMGYSSRAKFTDMS